MVTTWMGDCLLSGKPSPYVVVVVVVVVVSYDSLHASRDLQVVACCHSGSGQPICYEDDQGGDATGCLVVGVEIGLLGS